VDLYSTFIVGSHLRRSGMDHSFTCKLHHACFHLISVHQIASPLIETADISLNRLFIGHTPFTHSYLLNKEQPPTCDHCKSMPLSNISLTSQNELKIFNKL